VINTRDYGKQEMLFQVTQSMQQDVLFVWRSAKYPSDVFEGYLIDIVKTN
jgi:hypothetical protein